MAIDLSKLNLPSLVRSEVTDMRNKNKFPVNMAGNHREAVLAYDYVPAEKGKGRKGIDISASFQAKVRILESDNPLAVSREYTLRFWLGGDHQKYSDRDRLAFIAACFGETSDQFTAGLNAEEAKAKALKQEQKMVDTSESNGFAADENGEYPAVIYHTRVTIDKERAAIKDGKPILEPYQVANDYFSPV